MIFVLGSAMVQVITHRLSGLRVRNLAVEWFTTRDHHSGKLWLSAIMLLLAIYKVIHICEDHIIILVGVLSEKRAL